MSVEEAQLQRGQKEQEDQIVVQAVVRERAGERGCFLMKGSDWLALKRIIDSGAALPDSPRQAEFLWAEPWPADEFSGGNMYFGIFHEDPKPGGDEANPRKTPYFAFCYKDADPGGTSGPTAWYDVAHVGGTPEARPTSPGSAWLSPQRRWSSQYPAPGGEDVDPLPCRYYS